MGSLFYIRNIERGHYQGSCFWWKIGDRGYTTDLQLARKFTREEAKHIVRDGIFGRASSKYSCHLVEDVQSHIQHRVELSDLALPVLL